MVAVLDRLRAVLEAAAPGPEGAGVRSAPPIQRDSNDPDFVSALQIVNGVFALTEFESDLLMLCCGVELDAGFARLCGRAQGASEPLPPTFGLALSTLPGAHWSALSPAAPLRSWRLIEIGPSRSLTTAPLRVDERILNYLVGVRHADERLSGVLEPAARTVALAPSQRVMCRGIAAAWSRLQAGGDNAAVQLVREQPALQRAMAAEIGLELGMEVYSVAARRLPTASAELARIRVLLERECVLDRAVLMVDCHGLEGCDAEREQAAAWFLETVHAPLIVAAPQRRRSSIRRLLTFPVAKPRPDEQRVIWQSALEPADLSREFLDSLTAQFQLDAPDIEEIAAAAIASERSDPQAPDASWEPVVWSCCRDHLRRRLEDLAQRVDARARWDDLILPPEQINALRDLVSEARHRSTVYEVWGFSALGHRGVGISALFSGASGTGKTLAAEVLASELQLDLYRVDLSALVSKYIGETEKNLRRVFDAAEESGAILLFDEADALFGKRSEVRDSHDRYANMEVSYLLQRVETYRGIAILTTNLMEAIDTAFLRRLRFIVTFPFPGLAERAAIWSRVFPAQAPTSDLDFRRLAQLNTSGGTIRNIALRAAFLAAASKEPIRYRHIAQAARSEYAKLGRPLPESELRGWSSPSSAL